MASFETLNTTNEEEVLMGQMIMLNISNSPPTFIFKRDDIKYKYVSQSAFISPHFKLKVIEKPDNMDIKTLTQKAKYTFNLLIKSFKLITTIIKH